MSPSASTSMLSAETCSPLVARSKLAERCKAGPASGLAAAVRVDEEFDLLRESSLRRLSM